MKKLLLLVTTMVFLFSTTAFAAPLIFFGEDNGLGESTPLAAFPNANAAESSFLSNLVGVGTETFEGYPTGTGTPLAISFAGAGTATINGTGQVATVPPGTTNGFGRYAISGSNFWEGNGGENAFSISFSNPISALGFYGIDIGDFSGELQVQLSNGGINTYTIPNTIDNSGGSVLFWGIIDQVDLFSSIAFINIGSGADFFGFDNFTIGSVEQVRVPEPATLILIGTGLFGIATGSRRKKSK